MRGANARAVAVGVLHDPVGRCGGVTYQPTTRLEYCVEAMLTVVVRDPHVEVPPLREGLLGKSPLGVSRARALPPDRSDLAAGVDGLAPFKISSQQGSVERGQTLSRDGVKAQL